MHIHHFASLTVACFAGCVGAGVPTWVSDAVTASSSAGTSARVDLRLRRNGRATVGVDFDDSDPVCTSAAEVCDGRDNNCNGLIDEGSLCAASHAAGACVAGICYAGTCDPGFGDCDGISSNGCEASLTASVIDCGACGNPCLDGEGCVAGRCVR